MDELLQKIANILEEEQVNPTDELRAYAQWDSLSVLSVIAMLDATYGVNLHASELETIQTPGQLWALVQERKA